ncbi:MAG TPA: hypothetical protein VOA78_11235 [Candidatus Dormibacteraeota bacterium]|nr:hypothetical protein [Candidatus Dormibacteraeota bacterium]
MQLSAIINARVLGFIETFDLAPRGEIFFPDVVQEIVKRYGFQKFPKTFEEFDESKGIEFLEGKIGNKSIQKFVIWNTLLVVETRSSTTDSKEILEGVLEWGAAKFGLTYRPGMIKRYAYVSDLSFYSDLPILNASPVLTNLAAKTSQLLSEIWQEPVQYESVSLTVGHDPMARKYAIAPFSITRRAEARFSENKYFSEAPLPTDAHITLLEDFEKDIERFQGQAKKQK